MVTNTKHQRPYMSWKRDRSQVSLTLKHPAAYTREQATSCRQRAGEHQRAANQPQMGSASEQEQHRTVKTLKEGEMTLETVERTLQKDDKTVEGGGICPLLQ